MESKVLNSLSVTSSSDKRYKTCMKHFLPSFMITKSAAILLQLTHVKIFVRAKICWICAKLASNIFKICAISNLNIFIFCAKLSVNIFKFRAFCLPIST